MILSGLSLSPEKLTSPFRGTIVLISVYTRMVEKKITPNNFPSRFHGNIEPHSVLICDDEELMRQVTGQMLQRAGYSVLYASNGDETVEVFKSCLTGVDLVILDLSMPERVGSGSLQTSEEYRFFGQGDFFLRVY